MVRVDENTTDEDEKTFVKVDNDDDDDSQTYQPQMHAFAAALAANQYVTLLLKVATFSTIADKT